MGGGLAGLKVLADVVLAPSLLCLRVTTPISIMSGDWNNA
jgi:hypothetical protein